MIEYEVIERRMHHMQKTEDTIGHLTETYL
jgi:hypothetical protein